MLQALRRIGLNGSSYSKGGPIYQKYNGLATFNNEQSGTSSIQISDLPNVITMKKLGENRDYFLAFTDIVKYLTQYGNSPTLNEANQRLVRALKHTISYGKKYSGQGFIDSYKLIESPENLTPPNIKLAHILSWCIAMLEASYMIEDDILDNDETRNGFPCWHRLDDIGLSGINDSILIEKAIFIIIKKYFSNHHCYLPTLELFHKTNYKYILGQTIDLSCTIDGKPRFKDFTKERMKYFAEYKIGCFSYELQLRLALFLAGLYDPELHQQVAAIAPKIGLLLLAHNDLQDSYGKFELVGKRSVDIRNGRCTWLAVETLERGTPAQRCLFMEHYGVNSDYSEQIIHNLYRELKLSDVYFKLEEETINTIYDEASHISHTIPKQVTINYLTDVTSYRKGYCCE